MTEKERKILTARRLKMLRKDTGLSAEQVAERLKIGLRTLRRYECDTEYSVDFYRIQAVPTRNLIKLAKLYNCSVDYILGLDEKETAKWND